MIKKFTGILGAIALSANVAVASDEDDWSMYAVTVTNGSTAHVLTPPLVVAHKRSYGLYHLGHAASEGLEIQAETGNPAVLKGEADDSDKVFATATGDNVIKPGESMIINIMAPRRARISLTSMLAGTNDALVTLNAAEAPRWHEMYKTTVIDAGSEMNNEMCTHIPGPPCAANSGNNRTSHGEGMVSFHTGIHGSGDLDPAAMDWRDAIAIVSIKRVK